MAKKVIKITTGAVIEEPGSTRINKTGSWRALRPVIDKRICKKCSTCRWFCPDAAITKDFKIDYRYCKGCLICVQTCPFKAIKVEKEKK